MTTQQIVLDMIKFNIPFNDLKKFIFLFSRKVGLLYFFLLMLYFDGVGFGGSYLSSQVYVDVFALIGFTILYFRSTKRVRELMIYAFVIGVIGEQIFSIWLHMWTYRLEHMPLYAPLGHAAIFARTFAFSKAPIVQKYAKDLVKILAVIILIYALYFLIIYNDVFGFVMTIFIFLLLLKRSRDRVFFLTMYVVVMGVEIAGTTFKCWYWPKEAFEVFSFLPSANPPSGISLFYFLLDIGCFVFYTQRHKITWKRVLNIRKFKK